METLVGPEAGQEDVAVPTAAVHMFVINVGVVVVRSIKLMSFDPVLATTAIPVAGLTATSLGAEDVVEPTAMRVDVGGA
jgi:hypothetical protein